MPSQRVGIDIQANVTGSAAVQQLIQQLQQLNSLISPVAGRDWIGPGGVKGMIATAGQMSPPVAQQYLQSAVEVGHAEAARLGLMRTQSQVEAQVGPPATAAGGGGAMIYGPSGQPISSGGTGGTGGAPQAVWAEWP